MSAQQRPLIVVAGATSKQGRSVAASLLASGEFRVRALTRNPSSPQARAWPRPVRSWSRCHWRPATAASSPGRSGPRKAPS